MKFFHCAVLYLVIASVGLAQRHPLTMRQSGLSLPHLPSAVRQSQDTIRVLAMMVQFKQDIDARTSGNGLFLLSGSPNQIDPPPHDSAFFANKLLFLKNYYRKVSNGRVVLDCTVMGGPLTVADSLSAYSPQRAGNDRPMAQLIIDSWTAASVSFPSFPFNQYDAFVVFHAGVGRDINLVSVLGFDPTPYDLPSLFVGISSLRSLLNDATYPGVPVSGGTFHVTNSLILPEMETRVFESLGSSDTLQLSTNGLLAATFGSFLGLPDLFDTKTGRSGIGQFGLMDGAAIFAFGGLFPPEPSAWEKSALGWLNPIQAVSGTQSVSLPAVGLTDVGTDSVMKIPITSSEYFLVENRIRDPRGDGQQLSIVQNGLVVTKHFMKDTTGFFFNDVSGIYGTVVDVEDFDWALSGDMTQEGFEGGGILLWHVDESVIDAKRASNTVNADPLNRGVDLEEADGSQDIGQIYDILQPGSGTEVGWPLDQWFSRNGAPIYKNRFDALSFPNSNSNSGAHTFVAIMDFSDRSDRMTLTITTGEAGFQRIEGLTKQLGTSALPATVLPQSVIIPSGNAVYVFQKDGSSKISDPGGLLSLAGGQFPVAAWEGVKTYLAGAQDSTLFLWDLDSTTSGVSANIVLTQVTLPWKITAPPLIMDSLGTLFVVVGGEHGTIWNVGLNGTIRTTTTAGSDPVLRLIHDPSDPTSLFAGTASEVFLNGTTVSLPVFGLGWLFAGGKLPSGVLYVAAEQGGTRVLGLDGSLEPRWFDVSLPSGPITDVSVADIDHNGVNDILVAAGSRVFALNYHGALLDFFPLQLHDGTLFTESPRSFDVNNDGLLETVSRTSSGAARVFGEKGVELEQYPFQLSSPGAGSLTVFRTQGGKTGILSVQADGSVEAWELNVPFSSPAGSWPAFLLDAAHSNFNGASSSIPPPLPANLLPVDRTYNWPNPVYGTSTQLRFFTTEPARITVTIVDVAGNSVAKLGGESRGGVDEEMTWDVSRIQSGIYFARLEAAAGSRTEAVIFKIAVVK